MKQGVPAPATETATEVAQRFAELAARWKAETRHSSKMKTILEHPAYLEILVMGEKAVPLILAALEKHEKDLHLWFRTLRKITGTDPLPKESDRKAEEVAAAWLAWGRVQGYR